MIEGKLAGDRFTSFRQPPRHAWMNGKIIPWDQCVVHGRSQSGFFGANIFEGIRAYWNDDEEQLYIFKMKEHLDRLAASMKAMRMKPPYAAADIAGATAELMRANEFREHVQCNVVAYFGFPTTSEPLNPTDDTGMHITAIRFPRSPKVHQGAAACVSTWRRSSDDSVPSRIKIAANYQNNRLAQTEAVVNGYDVAIFLNREGEVSEGPGACLLMVRGGKIHTPTITADILESITRDTLMTLAREDLGLEVVERDVDRTELYAADELLLCGSIAEVLPVVSVDRIPVGDGEVGAVTRQLQELYFAAVEGRTSGRRPWLTPVY